MITSAHTDQWTCNGLYTFYMSDQPVPSFTSVRSRTLDFVDVAMQDHWLVPISHKGLLT